MCAPKIRNRPTPIIPVPTTRTLLACHPPTILDHPPASPPRLNLPIELVPLRLPMRVPTHPTVLTANRDYVKSLRRPRHRRQGGRTLASPRHQPKSTNFLAHT